MSGKKNTNLLALTLLLPMLVLYAAYLLNHDTGLIPTGFYTYDNISYVAYGKQYLDADQTSLFYTNPLNDRAYPAVYLQPQSLFFAFLMKLGVPPGAILIPFTLVCAFWGFRLMIRLYDLLQPDSRQRVLHIWLLCWGGGLLCLSGLAYHLSGNGQGLIWADMFALDPDHGWWGLNWGRALFFSCEAYYHLVFLTCILSVYKQKWMNAILLLFLISLSHPFTGLELIGIVCAFCFWELCRSRKSLPYWFAIGCLAALLFHLWFYFVYMAKAPDYISVRDQYTLNWRMRWYRMLPAYALTGTLAVATMFSTGIRHFFQVRSNRLFASWFLVAFFLINHEMFMTPRQPVHFTRGYVWTSLILLGLPALSRLTLHLHHRRYWALICLTLLFFLDNILWIGRQASYRAQEPYYAYLDSSQKEVLLKLNAEASNKSLVVSGNTDLAYFSSVYTEAWPWYSHPFTTPFAAKKKQAQDAFFEQGLLASEWSEREVFFVLLTHDSVARQSLHTRAERIFSNSEYIIYRMKP